ncbi:MAG: RNA polymerase sigma factor [Thermoanaerobaculia bacterium]|nr:RNA polymerase sigma factor [Thermoanaerobaculia bacterium]
MRELTDNALMKRVQEGEIARMGELFERHHRRLYNFFLRLTGNRQTAEDLVQEAFVRMIRYRHSFRGDGEFTSWMYTMARNLTATYFRRGVRAITVPEEEAEEPAVEETQESELENREEAGRLREALMKLPPDKREVLLLARFEMMKHRQIADLLGCSVGAVKVRIHRAMKQLRQSYRELQSEAP